MAIVFLLFFKSINMTWTRFRAIRFLWSIIFKRILFSFVHFFPPFDRIQWQRSSEKCAPCSRVCNLLSVGLIFLFLLFSHSTKPNDQNTVKLYESATAYINLIEVNCDSEYFFAHFLVFAFSLNSILLHFRVVWPR